MIQIPNGKPGLLTRQAKLYCPSRTWRKHWTIGSSSPEQDPQFSSVINGGSARTLKAEDSAFHFTTAKVASRSRTRSPEARRLSTGHLLNCVPEDTEMSVDPRRLSFSSQGYYGSTSVGTGYPTSLEMEDVDDLSEEEEEWIVDEELAKNGLYRGNYKNLMFFYTIVPFTTLLALVFWSFFPLFAFRSSAPSAYPYPPYLPFPLPEFFTAAALWCLSYLLRDILHEISIFLISSIPLPTPTLPFLASLLANILQNASALVLRQLAVPILLIPFYSTGKPRSGQNDGLLYATQSFPTWEDIAFKRVWWIGLGWAAAEAIVGIKQGYENIALYKDVLVNVRKKVVNDSHATNPIAPSTEQSTVRPERSVNDTPTQRSIDARRKPIAAEGGVQNSSDFPRRRDHSNSLSSIESASRNEGMSLSPVLGERHPLLSLNRMPLSASPVVTRSAATEIGRLIVEDEVERDLEELIRLKTREDLEELYGMPVVHIPIFISCLHRINCILSSLSACLILTAAYMRSTLAFDYSSPSGYHPPIENSAIWSSNPVYGAKENPRLFTPSNKDLFLSFSILLVVQISFSIMHTPWILPRIGVHTFVYIGFLVWLGIFFAALGFWEALS